MLNWFMYSHWQVPIACSGWTPAKESSMTVYSTFIELEMLPPLKATEQTRLKSHNAALLLALS